jgi:hypothetical protein
MTRVSAAAQERTSTEEWCKQVVNNNLSAEERKVVEELKRTVGELEDRLEDTKVELSDKLDEQTKQFSAALNKLHDLSADTNSKLAVYGEQIKGHLSDHAKHQDPRIDRLSRTVGNLRRWKIEQQTLQKSARHNWQGYAALGGIILSIAGVVAAFWLAIKTH